jgi:hypothetical protein
MDRTAARPEPQQGFWASLPADARDALLANADAVIIYSGNAMVAEADRSSDVLIVWSPF